MKTVAVVLAVLAGCSTQSPIFTRGGLWETRAELVDITKPGMTEAEHQSALASTRDAARDMMAVERECRPDKTAANWLKAGDPADGGGQGRTCRYTRVELPGKPVDRVAECRNADGSPGPVTHTTGTLLAESYDLRIELTAPDGTRVITAETGKRLGACPGK